MTSLLMRFAEGQSSISVSLGTDEDDVDNDAQHRLGSFRDCSKPKTETLMLTSTAAKRSAEALPSEELLLAAAATRQLQCVFELATCFDCVELKMCSFSSAGILDQLCAFLQMSTETPSKI